MPEAETLRTYVGEAFQSTPVDDPHPQVAALLVAQSLQGAAAGVELGVQLWELPDRWVLAVTGQSYPRQAAAMREAVSGALARTVDALDPKRVRGAVAQVRRDILLRAQTPAGLVGTVGRAMEAGGDPLAAARHLEGLSAVDVASTRAYLSRLLQAGPVRAEVRP
jgi:hypothetical protein